MADKMTQREFLTMVANGENNEITQRYATEQIAKLDRRNANRKSTPTASQKANEKTMAQITDYMATKEIVLASEIAAEFGISTQKASGLLKLLTDRGEITVSEVKIPKQGKRKAYSLTTPEANEV